MVLFPSVPQKEIEMATSECKYWRLSDAFANGDADSMEVAAEVPCCRCVRCRQAASDGILMAFEDGYVAEQIEN